MNASIEGKEFSHKWTLTIEGVVHGIYYSAFEAERQFALQYGPGVWEYERTNSSTLAGKLVKIKETTHA